MKPTQITFPFVTKKEDKIYRIPGGYGWDCANCGKKITDDNGKIITNREELPEYHPDFVLPRNEITYPGPRISGEEIQILEVLARQAALKSFDQINDNNEDYYHYFSSDIDSNFYDFNNLCQELSEKFNIKISHQNVFNYEWIKSKDHALEKLKETASNCKENIQDLANKLNKKERFTSTYYEEHPLCQDCRSKMLIHCSEPGCDEASTDIEDFNTLEIKGKDIPYCKEHVKECTSCDKYEHVENMLEAPRSSDWYCKDCFWQVFGSCENCDAIEFYEDMNYDDNTESSLCNSCYDRLVRNSEEKEDGVDDVLNYDQRRLANSFLGTINQNKFFPIDENAISKTIIPILNLANGKNFKNINDLLNFLEKRIPNKEAKAAVFAIILVHRDPGPAIESALKNFQNQLQEYQNQKEKYGKIFKPYPVRFELKGGKSHDGDVFAIYPTTEFLNYADLLLPGNKQYYESELSRKGPHHLGSLAYARFSVSNNVIVVDNLQTDLDAQSMDDSPHAKWWAANIKKSWHQILLDALRRFGQEVGMPVYLTSFEMQQVKWNNKVPGRNKDVYDRIPEMMGFKTDTVNVKPEMLKMKEYQMARIAYLSKLFVKAAKQVK